MVTDFLLEAMCVAYRRPRLVKTLRVVVEEMLAEESEEANFDCEEMSGSGLGGRINESESGDER